MDQELKSRVLSVMEQAIAEQDKLSVSPHWLNASGGALCASVLRDTLSKLEAAMSEPMPQAEQEVTL